jgi:hypothetical protein
MSDSELRGGSPHPCRLRNDRLAPVSKFDYVLTHTRFMGSRKLSSFSCHRVGRYLTSPAVMYTEILCGHPWIAPSVVSRGTRTDSLIIVANCGHMWGLEGLTCVMLLGCYLTTFKLTRVSAKPSDTDDTCLLQSFPRSVISPMFI